VPKEKIVPKEKTLHKVTGLDIASRDALMKVYKDVRLTQDLAMCFVNVLPGQAAGLESWCAERGLCLYVRVAEWRQLVPPME